MPSSTIRSDTAEWPMNYFTFTITSSGWTPRCPQRPRPPGGLTNLKGLGCPPDRQWFGLELILW
jgi:hypothetical protein